MADPTVGVLTEAERAAKFATWLKPLTPVRSARQATIDKVSPWRKQFVDAQRSGFSWTQLAKEIGPRDDIGVKVSGRTLMEYVIEACRQAGEPLQLNAPTRASRARTKQKTRAAKAAGNSSSKSDSSPAGS